MRIGLKLAMVASTAMLSMMGSAAHASCPALPNNITNGQMADAVPLMADMNQLRDCLNGVVGTPSFPVVVITNTSGGATSIKNPVSVAPFDFNLPSGPGTAGQVLSSNGPGSPMSWVTAASGGKPPLTDGYPVIRPAAASLTGVNLGSSTVVDHVNGPLSLVVPGNNSADQMRELTAPVPSGAPFTVTGKLDCMPAQNNGNFCGVFIGNAAQRFTGFGLQNDGGTNFSVIRASFVTSGPGLIGSWSYNGNPKWFRIYDDGTNLIYYISSNGADWSQVYTETVASTSMGTITQAGVMVENYGTRTLTAAIHSLEIVSGTGTDSSWQ